ncbi:FMN-binding negative transcriptional regulator [Janthinobacterium fluminis]|uniref:FMN-binding negative transcriptional regulator n=1 Tax=Janthinobacterium fluminis TaxID=2987524 RepID=A0ABT5K8R9_9BURK|nr:FMN-binding negative transcriptional regulator [Janthinobacterium fluminis]MDC8760182.1 FMN-binding negative transcriptional regulator [Janthinobacterium fluminis]
MYQVAHHEESRLDVMHALIAAHPLGTLVSQDAGGLCADHIPFEIGAPTSEAPFGVLRGHVARANPLWRREAEVLTVFQGAQAYISPAWYEEKAHSGKVVPTYNYAVVHGHGRLRAIHDPAWLLALLEDLTRRHEAAMPAPWRVADAPPDYIAKLLKAIVGIEIPLDRIEGKWKASQNHSAQNKLNIAAGLGAGHPMAALVAAL